MASMVPFCTSALRRARCSLVSLSDNGGILKGGGMLFKAVAVLYNAKYPVVGRDFLPLV